MRGVRAWKPVTSPTTRALASWLSALWGRLEGARGGQLLPGPGASRVRRSPSPDRPSFGACGQGPLAPGAGGAGVGTRHETHSTPCCELALRAVGAAREHPGGAPLDSVWGVRRGPLPTGCGCGGCGRGDLSATPHRALLPSWPCSLWGRYEGARGGVLFACVRGVRSGALPHPRLLVSQGVRRGPTTHWLWKRCAGVGAWPSLAPSPVPQFLVCCSCAVVRCVLCALPGFASPGGRCCLAPVFVPWLWPEACLSGVPRGPALVRRASSGPVALGAPVGFLVAVVPSPTPGAVAPGFTGWLRAALGSRPRTGLIVPAAGPCRGKGAGRAPRRSRSGPRDGVVPGGSLRLRSWAACAAVVRRVWTRSLTRPVSRTVRLSTGDSAGAPELFRVDADTSPF